MLAKQATHAGMLAGFGILPPMTAGWVMKTTLKWRGLSLQVLVVYILLGGCSYFDSNDQQVLTKLDLPEGFAIQIYASGVTNVRQMVLGDNGIVYAGSREEGKVYAITDHNKDIKGDTVYYIDEDLHLPSGVSYRDGSLYVAAVNRILRYDNIDNQLENPPDPVVVTESYPTEDHHGWKFIAFGPDGKLYVPVGAPCNICERDDEIYASITRMNSDGTDREIIAQGVRNSVGFDWHPETRNLWFTDNGRDWLGDDQPPCELNHLTEAGQHFGFPYKHGADVWDPEFGEQGKEKGPSFREPALELDPHVAPLGMIFYTGEMFPEEYHNEILIAEHGSWNRSKKVGYRITAVSLESDNEQAVTYETFIDGWLQDNDAVWGRPVDLLQLSDGSVLISDDHRGVIYRVLCNNP